MLLVQADDIPRRCAATGVIHAPGHGLSSLGDTVQKVLPFVAAVRVGYVHARQPSLCEKFKERRYSNPARADNFLATCGNRAYASTLKEMIGKSS